VIDERFRLDAFAPPGDQTTPVLIDLDGATRITSFGVREWMHALRTLPTSSYYYVRVRPAIVAQFNSVTQFGGQGSIVTMYCPYLCSACEHSFDVLVDLRKHPEIRSGTAPNATCPQCKGAGIFDDIESTYFGHVASVPTPQIPAAIEAAIDGTAVKPAAMKVHKAVEGDLTILWLKGALHKSARLERHTDGLEGKVLVVLELCEITSAEGTASLGELVKSQTAEVFLALVPMPLLRSLMSAGIDVRNLISCVIHPRCMACGTTSSLEVRGWGAVPPADAALCGACGKTERAVPWTAEDAAALMAMHFVAVPAEIEDYIRIHADWKSHTSVAGQRGDIVPMGIEPAAKIGKYEVIRRIGVGGMADVLLGRQLGVHGFEKKVVIKRILPHLACQARFVKMFLEEARVAARLQHDNIVQVYDLLHERDEYYTILEFVRGADLNVLLRVCACLDLSVPVEIACRIVGEVCAGLNAAHSYADDNGTHKPIVHRDVSPHNVLLSTEGAVKITDFGIAKAVDSLTDDTDTGVLKGKVIYMPPEAIVGEGADHRADIYAAAVVLYQCLAGKNPFNRGSGARSMRAVLDDEVPDIASIRSDVPATLAAIIRRSMQRDRTLRHQTAAALHEDLDDFIVSYGKPATAARVGSWTKDLIARGREMRVAVPLSVPSPGAIEHEHNPTVVTTAAKGLAPLLEPDEGDEWFDDHDLEPLPR
jgi:serine/threonine protein kinase